MTTPLPKLVLATGNPSKLRLLQALIVGLAQGVLPEELAARPTVQESGRTVQENAVLKAKAYYDCTGLPALSGDSGLLLMDLPPDSPEQPGTQIRRIVHGENTTDEEMLDYYMNLAHRYGGRLRAAYQNAHCLYAGPGRVWLRTETPEECARSAFYLADRPCAYRHPGWPLDSLAVRMDTGAYFMEEGAAIQREEIDAASLAQPYRPWFEASLQALLEMQRKERSVPT